MPLRHRLRPVCPRCGGRSRRLHRRWWERGLAAVGLPTRRYACRNVECDWVGRAPRKAPPPAAPQVEAAVPERRDGPSWRAVAAVLAGLGIAVLAAAPWQQRGPQPEVVAVGPHKVLRGASYDGDPLPGDHPLVLPPLMAAAANAPAAAAAPAALQLRRHCAWGDPGRNPYQGSVKEALTSARLPAEVVAAIEAQVQAGKPDDRLTITTVSIRGDQTGQEFSPRAFAMTFGRTLCVGSRVNFKRDHFERASLYQAADYRGQVHSVMIPDVCGNVSVLGSEDQLKALSPTEPDAVAGDEADGSKAGGGTTIQAARGNTIAEPPGWAMVGLALAVAALVRARARRKKDD